MTTLITERLALRPVREGDGGALFALLGDPIAMEFWDRDPLPRLGTAEALLADELAAAAAGDFQAWMVLEKGEPVGSVDLSGLTTEETWLGFMFRPTHWGRGLATEALQAVIAQAFGVLKLRQLGARVQTGNLRAIRLLHRLEFSQRESLPAYVRRGGRFYDCAVLRREASQSTTAKGE
jgi:RimJ/RimL family protein N-acetyltransferase